MAARRGKSQARRSGGGGGNGLPGWAWLVIGVLLTIVVVLALPRFMSGNDGQQGGFFRIGPQPDPDAQPRGSRETDPAFDPGSASRPAAPARAEARPDAGEPARGFDFYEVLPGEEVAMTDAQLAAMQREEARRQAAAMSAAEQAADAQARAIAAATGQPLPAPLPDATPAPAPRQPEPAPARTTTPATTPAAPAPSRSEAPAQATAAATPYILQAGAFHASGDAEAAKARIALLGLNARVESASIDGKTVYRVRMGPYASATELAEAKRKLENGGLQAMAIRAK